MDGNNLEKLKDRLYKKGEIFEERQERTGIPPEREKPPPSYWQSPEEKRKMPKKMKKITIILLIIFFVIFLGLAFYFLFFGTNIISSRNINIEIKGPSYVNGGQPSNINVFIENKNKNALELADLIFEFPDNTFSSDGAPLSRERFSLGKINPGQVVNKSIDVAFFGLENEEKKINITLEYRLADSNAIFAKSQEYRMKIAKPAIGVSISLPKEVNSRQELNIMIEAVSNSESIAKNLSLQMVYPEGFQFLDANPKPSSSNNIWSLGDIAPLEKKEITIKGIIEGQDLEERAFNASVGVLDEGGNFNPYGASSETLVIKKSPLNLSIFINGQDVEKNIARPGDSMRVDLQWLNNMTDNIRDANIELTIRGNSQDEQSISVMQGSYRMADKKLIWNSSSLPDLASINPGSAGKAQFSFSIKDPLPINNINDKNFSLVLEAEISGIGTSEQRENQEISTAVQKEIKIASPFQLTASVLHYAGVFKNTGPMPPQVAKETTYTVHWSLGNNSNDFSKVIVSAALPSYVRWLNVISPADADIKFRERDGTVVWNVGDVPAGSGIVLPSKEISFQIGLTPSASQINSSPILVNEQKLDAYDNFIQDVFNGKSPSLDIMLKDDEQFKYNEGRVIQ
jgi:flagellar basal body-associated protein FliL